MLFLYIILLHPKRKNHNFIFFLNLIIHISNVHNDIIKFIIYVKIFILFLKYLCIYLFFFLLYIYIYKYIYIYLLFIYIYYTFLFII
ncbi:hypothetical protein PFBG_02709 [Plasmodium falciparum 7G8]|uniref:Uncharacterized protein n=1 Tax=Plasmodium falciparum (isolate 7G8) TaxID=57266 RepID=W7F1B1_PLAF8|nr:hypothetical protein PFBG_02709 [Plasmodium falciparum 7G8]